MRVRTSGELGLVRGQLAVFHGFWVTLVNNLALINLLTSLEPAIRQMATVCQADEPFVSPHGNCVQEQESP